MKTIEKHQHILSSLVRTNHISLQEEEPIIDFASTGAIGHLKIIVPLPQSLKTEEIQRLQKKKLKLEISLTKVKEKLKNPSFQKKAPKALIEKEKKHLDQMEKELATIIQKLNLLNN